MFDRIVKFLFGWRSVLIVESDGDISSQWASRTQSGWVCDVPHSSYKMILNPDGTISGRRDRNGDRYVGWLPKYGWPDSIVGPYRRTSLDDRVEAGIARVNGEGAIVND